MALGKKQTNGKTLTASHQPYGPLKTIRSDPTRFRKQVTGGSTRNAFARCTCILQIHPGTQSDAMRAAGSRSKLSMTPPQREELSNLTPSSNIGHRPKRKALSNLPPGSNIRHKHHPRTPTPPPQEHHPTRESAGPRQKTLTFTPANYANRQERHTSPRTGPTSTQNPSNLVSLVLT